MPPKSIATYFKPAGAAAAKSSTGSAGGGLSVAAKEAIMKAKDLNTDVPSPRPAKRAKTSTEVASSSRSSVQVPKASSREELRKALEGHPSVLPLLELELETMEEEWLLALQEELTKPYFLALKEFVMAEQKAKKVFPPAEDIYSWSRFCPLKDVRVVIVGQDPYHGPGQAHGLAFSVKRGVAIPPSLRNMYKEMAAQVPGFVAPKHGDLTEWAKHGVLLLNTSLTVRASECSAQLHAPSGTALVDVDTLFPAFEQALTRPMPAAGHLCNALAGSHASRGWEQFTAAVLKVVTARLAGSASSGIFAAKQSTSTEESPASASSANGVVLMAWGAHAQKMIAGLDTKRHLVLKSAHPSPLSASRGFFGNGHYTKCNDWLKERYGADGAIDWKSLGEAAAQT